MATNDLTLIRERHPQLDALLPALPADASVVFCRVGSDRSTLLFADHEMVGLPAFVFTRGGGKLALVADSARVGIEAPGVFDAVVAYGHEGLTEHRKAVWDEVAPVTLAVNQGEDDYLVDGLTAGPLRKL